MKALFPLFACLLLSVPANASDRTLMPQDQAQMYVTVLQRLLGPDDTYASPMPPGKVYIDLLLSDGLPPAAMKKIDDYDAMVNAPGFDYKKSTVEQPDVFDLMTKVDPPPRSMMPKDTEAALKAILSLPKYDLHWVADAEKALKTVKQSGAIEGGGLLLTVSNFEFLSDDRVYVSGDIYVANVVSGLCWYFFVRDKSGWHFEKRIQGPVS